MASKYLRVPAGAPNVEIPEFTPERRAALKQKVPFGTSDVVTLQFIAGYKPSTNKECR